MLTMMKLMGVRAASAAGVSWRDARIKGGKQKMMTLNPEYPSW